MPPVGEHICVEVRVVQGKARLEQVLSLVGCKQINTSAMGQHNGTSHLRNQARCARHWASPECRAITGG
jgi:hypothetical protein